MSLSKYENEQLSKYENEQFSKYENKETTKNQKLFTSASDEVVEILQDKEFESNIKKVAEFLGADATLELVKLWIELTKKPTTKTINGVVYYAGYKGINIVNKGSSIATLLDVTTDKNNVKLIFKIDGNKYLYQSVLKTKLKFEDLLEFTKNKGRSFRVNVKHEVLPTGDYHAVINDSILLS